MLLLLILLLLLLLLLFCDGGVLTSCIFSWGGAEEGPFRDVAECADRRWRCQQIWNVNKSQVNLKTRLSNAPSVSSLSPLSWFTGVLANIYMLESSKMHLSRRKQNNSWRCRETQTRLTVELLLTRFWRLWFCLGERLNLSREALAERKLGCKKSLAVSFSNCHVCSFHSRK